MGFGGKALARHGEAEGRVIGPRDQDPTNFKEAPGLTGTETFARKGKGGFCKKRQNLILFRTSALGGRTDAFTPQAARGVSGASRTKI
jgi:hypothetical protein